MNTLALGICIEAGVPVLLKGDPGVGKTSIIESMCRQSGRHLETVITSLREPSDLAGLPVIYEGKVLLSAPRWAHALNDAPKGLLFLDELTCAAPSVQAAALRLVHDRWCGDLKLKDSVSIVAAANDADIAAGGWELSAPMANRFVHLKAKLDIKTLTEGLISGFPAVNSPVLGPDWRKGRGQWAAKVAGFLHAKRQMALVVPKSEADRGAAWPSPRMWDEGVITVMAAADAARANKDTRLELIRGCVGDAAAIEFNAFLENADLPDPETLLKDPGKYKHSDRGDIVFTVLGSVVSAVRSNLTNDRYRAGWRILATAAKRGSADIAVAPARAMFSVKKSEEGLKANLVDPDDDILVFHEVLGTAGVMSK